MQNMAARWQVRGQIVTKYLQYIWQKFRQYSAKSKSCQGKLFDTKNNTHKSRDTVPLKY